MVLETYFKGVYYTQGLSFLKVQARAVELAKKSMAPAPALLQHL